MRDSRNLSTLEEAVERSLDFARDDGILQSVKSAGRRYAGSLHSGVLPLAALILPCISNLWIHLFLHFQVGNTGKRNPHRRFFQRAVRTAEIHRLLAETGIEFIDHLGEALAVTPGLFREQWQG